MPDSGFSIPRAFRAGFQTIARLTDDQAASVLDALTRATDSLTPARLAEQITQAVPSLEREDADAVIAAVLSIIAARRQIWTDVTSVELARDVAGSSDLELPSNQHEAFADRLAQLMDAEALRIAIKAQDIRTEHPQVFRRARVFTDMRPVFRDNVTEPPAGAVILETLKIEYFTEGLELAAFYVTLDQDDLRSLQGVIERALDKTESLKRVLASSSIAVGEFADAPRAEESG